MIPDAVERLLDRADVAVHDQRIELSLDGWADPGETAVDADGREDAGHYAGAAVRDPEGRLLFVRHGSGDDREWAVPGGHVEDGKRPREAAVREVREETGVDAEIERPLSVTRRTFVHPTADRTAVGHFVLFGARTDDDAVATDPGIDDEEIDAAAWRDAVPAATFARERLRDDLRRWAAIER